MPYVIKANETVSESVSRVVIEQIDRAVAKLTDGDLEHAAHQARRRIKRIRGVLRLIRGELGNLYCYENMLFRDAARKLADIRNAQASIETFEILSKRFPGRFTGDAYGLVRQGLEKRYQALIEKNRYTDKTLNEVLEILNDGRKRVESWPLSTDRHTLISTGYRKAYRLGRRRLKQARKEPSQKNLLELRKAVKYHGYQCQLLSTLRPKRMALYSASIKRMSDILGMQNDMAELKEKLVQQPEQYGTYHEIAELVELINQRQTELWKAAEPLGYLIFLNKPRQIEAMMQQYWKAWQEKMQHKVGSRQFHGNMQVAREVERKQQVTETTADEKNPVFPV